ncbi:type VI immunity family protein [Variovorax sp. ZT5P49]|uniref:type VI immunity family protein n=1 Tax=Variovorax sp. ZT5P49 TaxID=3443733 RepID=UPI003F45A089
MTAYEHIAIDLTDGNANVLLRSGIVAIFFLDDVHAAHAGLVKLAMQGFAARFMSGGPIYYPDADVFGEAGIEEVAALLEARVVRSAQPPKFALLDSALHASRFSATYCGMDREHLAELGWPQAVCGLRFTFSLDAMDENGLCDICDFATRCARALPITTGYVAPAFIWREGIDEDMAMKAVARLCRRYRCMDIPALLVDCFETGAGVKGVYWCNFLGPKVIALAGGEARLITALADTDARVEHIGDERLQVTLGSLPIFGDVNRRQDLSLYQWVFGLLEVALQPRTVPYMDFDEESMQAWIGRFTGSSS